MCVNYVRELQKNAKSIGGVGGTGKIGNKKRKAGQGSMEFAAIGFWFDILFTHI